MLYDALTPHSGQVVKTALREIAAPPPGDSKTDIQRTANASVALMRLGRPKHLWPLLDASGDPELRTLVIHCMRPYEVDVQALVRRLGTKENPSIRQAILLALGEYPSESLPPGDRQRLVQQCLSLYRSDPDPGIHAGTEWLLRRWGHEKAVNDARRELASVCRGDEPRREEIIARLAGGCRGAWYVNGQGHTMIAISMAVAAGGEQRSPAHNPRHRTAGRIVALSAHEVTIEEYERFAAVAGFDVNRPAKPAASHEGERFLCNNRTSFVGFRIARTIRE